MEKEEEEETILPQNGNLPKTSKLPEEETIYF